MSRPHCSECAHWTPEPNRKWGHCGLKHSKPFMRKCSDGERRMFWTSEYSYRSNNCKKFEPTMVQQRGENMISRTDMAKLVTRVYMLPDSLWDIEVIMPNRETLKGYVGKVEAGYYATKLSIILETEKDDSIERWLNDCHIENDGTYRGGENEKDSNSI